MRAALLTTTLTLLAVLAAACESDPTESNEPGTVGPPPDAGQPTTDIVFSGISVADALGPEEMLVSWPAAVLLPNLTGSAGMVYRVFRGDSENEALLSTTPIHTTGPGTTTWVDSSVEEFRTYYYKVVAVDTYERTSLSVRVTSGRTPSAYQGGVFDYDQDLLPLWSTPSPINPAQNCLSCHTMPGPGRLDLSTREGAYIGVGTAQDPDSFLVAFDPDATWAEFLSRMSDPYVIVEHLPWLSEPNSGLTAMEPPLREWANEGGTQEPDVTPPVFAIGGVGNAGSYTGQFIDFDTIELVFPHADDPETLPPGGALAGQIEYAIYGGTSTNDIDWDTPLALHYVTVATQGDPQVTAQVEWTAGPTAVLVVRPIDSAGRAVEIVPGNPAITPLNWNPADPNQRTQMKLRMRNQTPNEREIVVNR